jgi:hypothetical protein
MYLKTFATIIYPLDRKFITVSDYLSVVKQNVLNFLLTNTGQRVMRRSKFGIPLDELLFDPANDVPSKLTLLKTYIDGFLSSNFVGVVCSSVTEINKTKNSENGGIDIQIKLIDQNLGLTEILTLSNQ